VTLSGGEELSVVLSVAVALLPGVVERIVREYGGTT